MLDTMDLSWKVAMRNWAIYRKFLFSNIELAIIMDGNIKGMMCTFDNF